MVAHRAAQAQNPYMLVASEKSSSQGFLVIASAAAAVTSVVRQPVRADPALKLTSCGRPRMAFISFWAMRGPPQGAG